MPWFLQSAPIASSGFGGVVCASLESLLVEVELLLETVEAVCKSNCTWTRHIIKSVKKSCSRPHS